MKVPVSKLKHHKLNETIYSLSGIDDLVESIGNVGLLNRLVINSNYEVISGNRRLEAIRRLNWEEVEVEMVHSPPDAELQLIVHHNKQRVKTSKELINEYTILLPTYSIGQGKRNDLTSVRTNKGLNARDQVAENIGISSSQIGKLLFIHKNEPRYIDLIDDGTLTVNQAYRSTSWIVNQKNTIHSPGQKVDKKISNENFIFYEKSSKNMIELEDESVNLIFTSPPYWNKRTFIEGGGLGNEKDPKEYISNLVSHLKDCQRVLNRRGSMFLNLGDTFKDGNLLNIPHRAAIGLQDEGWILRNTIIWKKTNPKPSSSKNNLNLTYEFIFHLVKDKDYKYELTLDEMVNPPSKYVDRSPRHRDMNPYVRKTYPYMPRDGKNMGDYWSEDIVTSAVAKNFKTDNGNEHPAPFSEKIVILPILQCTDEGDIVLDPFGGTHTTGKVANSLNRKYVGYDIRSY